MLGLATGEFASQSFGGFNFNLPGGGDWSKIGDAGQGGGTAAPGVPSIGHIPGISNAQIATLITILVVGVIVLVFVHLWVSSVSRFMLFDAVATRRTRLREGWKRWGSHGFRYFLFQLAFGAISLAVNVILLGIPAFVLWKMGVFSNFKEHWGAFLSVLIIVLPIFMIVALAAAVFAVLVKDFAIPIIALENITIPDALRKLWEMIKANKGDYSIYVLMKIAISVVVGIGMGIINVIVFFILLVPVAIIVVGMAMSNPAMFKDPVTIALMVTFAIGCVFPLLFIIGVIATPAVVFYQSYVLNFFGTRYPPLWVFMHPEGVPTPPPPQMSGGHAPPPYDIVPPEPIG